MYWLCYFLFSLLWNQVRAAAICMHCCSSRDQNNTILSIEDVQTKAHLTCTLALPAVVTQNCAYISPAECYQFCSGTIFALFLSWRIIARLWQLGLSFWCWFQQYLRTFGSLNMAQFWYLTKNLPVRPVFILLQGFDRGGTWQKGSFGTYITILGKIEHVNRESCQGQKIFAVVSRMFAGGKW